MGCSVGDTAIAWMCNCKLHGNSREIEQIEIVNLLPLD